MQIETVVADRGSWQHRQKLELSPRNKEGESLRGVRMWKYVIMGSGLFAKNAKISIFCCYQGEGPTNSSSLPRISKIYPAQIIRHFHKIQVVVRDYPLIVSGMESQLFMLDLGQKVQTCYPLRLNKSKLVFVVKITLAVGTA